MIKAVIFDCFGVLTVDTWKEFLASLPNNQRTEAADLGQQFGRGLITQQDLENKIKQLTGKAPIYAEGDTASEVVKNTDLLQYIADLKLKYQYMTAVLSNAGSDWVRRHFLNEDEAKLFDHYVLSFEVGVTKPNPKIFLLTVEKLGVQPEECVFIDDSAQHCYAAEQVGMKAILYEDFIQTKSQLEEILAADSKD